MYMKALDQQLLAAVLKMDKAQVERLLAEGGDLNALYYDPRGEEECDHERTTLFTRALFEGDLSYGYVAWLIDKGADPNVPNDHTENPLYWAIWDRDYWLCYLLLGRGADPNNWVITPNGRLSAMDRIDEIRHYLKECTIGCEYLIQAMEVLLQSYGARRYDELAHTDG